MRIKDLFTVPEEQKMTEKALRRVLITSICSILLCMGCLAGTTWAWFTVEIENAGNVIEIGEPSVADVKLTLGDEVLQSGDALPKGEYHLLIERVEHAKEGDDLREKTTLYVTLTVQHGEETNSVVVVLDSGTQHQATVEIRAEEDFLLCWSVTWFPPASAEILANHAVITIAPAPVEDPVDQNPETDAPDETTEPDENGTSSDQEEEPEAPTESEANTGDTETEVGEPEGSEPVESEPVTEVENGEISQETQDTDA